MNRPAIKMLGVATLTLAFNVAASEAVKLDGLIIQGTTATGQCGAAKISVVGVGPDAIEFSGRINITSGANKVSLSSEPEPFFQDANQVACLDTPKGPMLVAKATCFATSCIPDDFRVIDPKTAKVVSKGTPDDGCNTACAEKALGVRLPESLRPAYAD